MTGNTYRQRGDIRGGKIRSGGIRSGGFSGERVVICRQRAAVILGAEE